MDCVWLELRDAAGKLWGEYDPARRLLRFRRNQETPAVLFDLADYDSRYEAIAVADSGKAGIHFSEVR